MIDIKNLSFHYKVGHPVIRNLDLEILDGRIYGLMGLNGTGKTTLLNLIAGLLFPCEGSVLRDDREVSGRDVETLQNVVLMPAEYELPKASIKKFIARHAVFYPAFSNGIFSDCLREFGIDSETKNLQALSLGQKHKFMLSFVLATGAGLLLLDEPLNGMDIPSRNAFRKLLMKYLGESQSVIISTHIAKDVENILSDVIILKDDGNTFCRPLEEVSRQYSSGIDSSAAEALYAEPCAEGFRVIRENNGDAESDIPLELLFNAVTKGGLK